MFPQQMELFGVSEPDLGGGLGSSGHSRLLPLGPESAVYLQSRGGGGGGGGIA